MSVEALETIGKECAKLHDLGYELKRLAAALYVTGNDSMSDRLHEYGDNILSSRKAINAATGQWVSSDLKRAQNSSVNLLNAALAGVVIATEDAETTNT